MKDSVLRTKSFAFAIRIVKMAQWLQTEKKEFVLSKQLLKSGTAIGALVSEAIFAQSRPDFISKMNISLKEAHETLYWIELLTATGIVSEEMTKTLHSECDELVAILVSTIKTTKINS